MNKLLPPNASALEHQLADTIEARTRPSISRVPTLWNVDTCPANLLPWLAWAEKVDEWSSSWSEAVQREVIRSHRLIRQHRGTKTSVVSAIQALSGTTSIKEWFEYNPKRTPHTFDVVITGGADYVASELQQSMIRAIERSKPVRSHYTLGVGITSAAQLNIVGVARIATFKRMEFNA